MSEQDLARELARAREERDEAREQTQRLTSGWRSAYTTLETVHKAVKAERDEARAVARSFYSRDRALGFHWADAHLWLADARSTPPPDAPSDPADAEPRKIGFVGDAKVEVKPHPAFGPHPFIPRMEFDFCVTALSTRVEALEEAMKLIYPNWAYEVHKLG